MPILSSQNVTLPFLWMENITSMINHVVDYNSNSDEVDINGYLIVSSFLLKILNVPAAVK